MAILAIALTILIFHPMEVKSWSFSQLFRREIYQPKIEIRVETLDEKIDRLALSFKVSSSTARAIMFCESSMNEDARHYNKNKTVDVGIWQINNYYWEDYLKDRGLDIYNHEDNLSAGFYLLDTYGTSLWNWSKHCWSKRI